ncbi:Ankyrin repeats containing protein [Candidatus Babela massiliensis]|uniref:Ankyrin repeats containing protein n=2 Tax=Candidatus Babela massiliensis TaxID=673862 RepID=V6DHN5_9BACT|nr:Ankyrin repeats containing protein [Candidatus Babela massiliensis]
MVASKEVAEIIIPECTLANINMKNSCGQSALNIVVHNRDFCKMLIESGADVNSIAGEKVYGSWFKYYLGIKDRIINIQDKYGCTYLMDAALKGDLKRVKYLLANGANLNIKNDNGKSALIYASEKKNIPVIRLLIKYGADIDAQDRYGNTALIIAIRRGYKNLALELISSGALVNLKRKDKLTALYFAIKKGDKEIIEKIKIRVSYNN